MRRITSLLAVGVLLATGLTSRADPPAEKTALTAEEREFFTWWDGLGWPDVRTLPFVKLWTGMYSRMGDAEPTQPAEGAFLVSEAAPKFTVFHTDLRTVTYETRDGKDVKPWQRVAFERADLAKFVADGLGGLSKEGPEIPWFRKSDPFQAHRWADPNQAFRIAVLARALAARGHEDLAHTMCDRARHEETRPRVSEQYGEDTSTALARLETLKDSIRAEARVVLERGYGDPSLSWADLLANTEHWAKAFAPEQLTAPDGEVATLRALVADAAARTAARAAPPPQSPAARAERLVRDLPDAKNRRLTQWGSTSDWEPEKAEGPVERLKALGLDAVPALIAALDDERPTRSISEYFSGHGQYRSTYSVTTVGELAWQILDHASGGALSKKPAGGPPTSGQPTRRQAAEAWFAIVKQRGEVGLWFDETAAGGPNAREAAERLVKRDPAAAIKAMEAGVLASNERGSRRNLMYLLVAQRDEAATAALLRLLPALSGSETGLTAADALWARGRREGLDDLIRRWTSAAGSTGVFASGFDREELAKSLARAGHVDAIRALADGLSKRAPLERLRVVEAFRTHHEEPGSPVTPPAVSPEIADAVEGLLGERLEDAERVKGARWGSLPVGDEPVVGEYAAWVLSERMPKRYAFDPGASAAARDAARVAAANAWRARRSLPPLEKPKRPSGPPPIPLEEVRGDLERVLRQGHAGARELGVAGLERRGLPLVPALREVIEAAKREDAKAAPGLADLEALLRRLSLLVSDAVPSDESLALPEPLVRALEGLRGRPFTARAYFGLWRTFAELPPDPGTKLTVRAQRDSAATGVRITVSVSASKGGGKRDDAGLSFQLPRGRRGEKSFGSGVGWLPPSVASREDAWDFGAGRFQKTIDEVGLDESFEAEGEIEMQR